MFREEKKAYKNKLYNNNRAFYCCNVDFETSSQCKLRNSLVGSVLQEKSKANNKLSRIF